MVQLNLFQDSLQTESKFGLFKQSQKCVVRANQAMLTCLTAIIFLVS